MKYGKLDYDFCTNRMDVAFSDGTRFGGLHCGEPMEVKMNGSGRILVTLVVS